MRILTDQLRNYYFPKKDSFHELIQLDNWFFVGWLVGWLVG